MLILLITTGRHGDEESRPSRRTDPGQHDELGLSVTEAAKGFGVVIRQQLHNIIAGRGPITPEMAVRLEKSIGRTDTWLRMPMNYDLAQSRKQAPSSNVERLQPKVA